MRNFLIVSQPWNHSGGYQLKEIFAGLKHAVMLQVATRLEFIHLQYMQNVSRSISLKIEIVLVEKYSFRNFHLEDYDEPRKLHFKIRIQYNKNWRIDDIYIYKINFIFLFIRRKVYSSPKI